MIGDPNWLYSTIAQSSAAIVAIVGGFITHSVLTLAAEKRSLKNQLSDKKSELKGLKKPLPLVRKDKLTEYELQSRRELVESNRIKISLLEAAISDIEIRLRTFSYPPNLWWGIIVLACLAVFGILSPVLIIVYEAFFTWVKLFTVILFGLGIIAFFIYIAFQIRALRRK